MTEEKKKAQQKKPAIKNGYNYQLGINFFFKKDIYLFMAALGLRCCKQAFSSCIDWGHTSLQCAGFSLQWLLLFRSMGSRHAGFSSCGSWALQHRLSSCGAWAQLLCGIWDLPGPGLEPVSPALAGGSLTTAPPGKSQGRKF